MARAGPYYKLDEAYDAKFPLKEKCGLYRVERKHDPSEFRPKRREKGIEFYWLTSNHIVHMVDHYGSVHAVFSVGSMCRLPLDIDIPCKNPGELLAKMIGPDGALVRMMDAWGAFLRAKNCMAWVNEPNPSALADGGSPSVLKWQLAQTCRVIPGHEKLSIHGCTVGAVPVEYMGTIMKAFFAFVREKYPDANDILLGVDENIYQTNHSLRIGRHLDHGDYMWHIRGLEHPLVEPIAGKTVFSVAREMRYCGEVLPMAVHDQVNPFKKIMNVKKGTKRSRGNNSTINETGTWIETTSIGNILSRFIIEHDGEYDVVVNPGTNVVTMQSDYCFVHKKVHSSNKVSYSCKDGFDKTCICHCFTETDVPYVVGLKNDELYCRMVDTSRPEAE